MIYETEGSPSGGFLSDAMISDQISALNRAFSPIDIKFRLANARTYKSANWFNNMGPEYQVQTDMKRTLRQGQRALDLDIYSVGQVLLLLSSKPII